LEETMIRKSSLKVLKGSYRVFIIVSAAFFMAASANHMINALKGEPAPCTPVLTHAAAR
jgi:hypothetical protein